MSKTRKAGRKGPSESATKFSVGTQKKGNDGNMWEIIKANNGVQRWKKVTNGKEKGKINVTRKKDKSSLKGTAYFTHWNGGRPIMVLVQKNNVHAYKYPDDIEYKDKYTKDDYSIPITSFKSVKKVYIGNSVKGDDSNGNKTFGKGNSILVHLSGKKYAFIGSGVFTFEIEKDDEFQNFYSAIGRNDVPYPILLGKRNVYFLLVDNGYNYLPRDIEEFNDFPSKHSWALDAYNVYYGDSSFNEKLSMKTMKKKHKKIKNQKVIQKEIY